MLRFYLDKFYAYSPKNCAKILFYNLKFYVINTFLYAAYSIYVIKLILQDLCYKIYNIN